jgi:DNA-binding NtrC family response regulator
MSLHRISDGIPEESNIFLQTQTVRGILSRLNKIAKYNGPILIEGESGTGKTTIARKFHEISPRKSLPLVELGAGEMPPGFVESMLFGHTKDAYTGATSFQKGLLAEADGGTLIINDIDQLATQHQSRLLRFLDDGSFFRLGEPGQAIVADVRIVVTTNKTLSAVAKTGGFLEDLYFRLKHWTVKVSPLRERPEDIVLLAEHYLACFQHQAETASKSNQKWHFSDETINLFRDMLWPNNIRGLRSTVENIALFCEGNKRPITLKQAASVLLDPCSNQSEDLFDTKQNPDTLMKKLLELTGGNIKLVSRMMAVSRNTVYKRIKENSWQFK